MNWSFDLEAPVDDQEVFLLCLCDGHKTIIMARRHAFPSIGSPGRPERKYVDYAWQSTWDGSRILHPFRAYAWAPIPDEKNLPEPDGDDHG